MELTSITARDLSEAWFLCLKAALASKREYTIERGSYVGQKRREIEFITLNVIHPGTRPIVPDTPPGIPPPSSMKYIEEYLPYLMTDKIKPNEQYTYGMYLQDQIAEVIRMYQDDGFHTNQACMVVGEPKCIYMSDPPCLRQIDTRIENSGLNRYRLNFYVYFRSWDLWAGFPSNLAALQLLKEYMADEIGVEDGELVACSKGLHLYDYSWDSAKAVVNR